jgi:KUP system potassium uptake protein
MSAAVGTRKRDTVVIGAIGVVYGDIELRRSTHCANASGTHRCRRRRTCSASFDHLLVLVIVVSLKYVTLIMRADNRGEGGILALTALVSRGLERQARLRWWLVGFGIFGAAMFYGDGMITPAISVLGAVEGLEIIAPQLHPFIVPVTLVIVLALFAIQKRGTASVGILFGPVMCTWFVVLAGLGISEIAGNPDVLRALNPYHAISFVAATPRIAFLTLGAVVLAVTGTEALYADMGHFGAAPIRRAWLLFVMPALVVNYFGQGALLLADPTTIKNRSIRWRRRGRSPARDSRDLRCLSRPTTTHRRPAPAASAGAGPLLKLQHTSERQIGQIYVPFVNWTLLVAVCLLVLGFRSSDNLGGAYGIAVTLAMMIDSVLIFVVMLRIWNWKLPFALAVALPLAAIDIAFLASNSLKIPDGGWFPLLVGSRFRPPQLKCGPRCRCSG